MTLALQILLILAVGAFVLLPLIQLRGRRLEREAAVVNRQRSIAERKTRVYTQLVELDFDRDSGKLSPEDHARMREETMAEALQVLAEEERLGLAPDRGAGAARSGSAAPAGAPTSEAVERMVEEMKKRRAASLGASNA